MYPHPLQLLERTLEPVMADLIQLGMLCIVALCVALIVMGAFMLGVTLVAAWRAAHAVSDTPEPQYDDQPGKALRLRPARRSVAGGIPSHGRPADQGGRKLLPFTPPSTRTDKLRIHGMEDA